MKTAPKRLIYVYTLLSWILTALALVFRVFARVYSYDSAIGYFEAASLFPTLHYVCLALVALLSGSALVLFRRYEIPETVPSGMKKTCVMERIGAAVGGISMLVVSISTAVFYYSANVLSPTGFTLFGLLTAICSVFFFLFFWVSSAVGKILHIFSGFTLVLHFVYILAATYFELYTPMNNPVKVLLQLTAVSAILYLLSDLRFYLGIARPVRHIATSTLFLSFSTVTVLSCGMFTLLTEAHTKLYYLYCLTVFALLVPAAIRHTRMMLLWVRADRSIDSAEDDGEETSDTERSPIETIGEQEAPMDSERIDLPTPDDLSENNDTRQDTEE